MAISQGFLISTGDNNNNLLRLCTKTCIGFQKCAQLINGDANSADFRDESEQNNSESMLEVSKKCTEPVKCFKIYAFFKLNAFF